MSDFRSKRVTVMGLGRFGGGVGAVRFLASRGARVTITDKADEAQLADPLRELRGIPLAGLRLGGHEERDFVTADLVVASPAVRWDHELLELARRAGVPVTSEMSLFWQHNPARVAAVTGSNGKSTTAALIHSILEASGRRAWLGGNIGRSLLPLVDAIGPDDWVVLELSSFQLEDLDRLLRSGGCGPGHAESRRSEAAPPATRALHGPEVAVVTNFSPNHLDRHGSLEDYRSAKQAILRWQTPQGIAVLNRDDPDVSAWPVQGGRAWFGLEASRGRRRSTGAANAPAGDGPVTTDASPLPLARWLRLPGRHNLENAAAAASAALAMGLDAQAVRRGLETFAPLPHRLQFVAEVRGRRFYNDSLATTPESAIKALEAFSDPLVLLAGGYDKQADLLSFARAIAQRVKGVALMGQTAETLAALISEAEACGTGASKTSMQVCRSFREAFDWGVAQSSPGDVVVLSPGCASYDWFQNFADRGDQFVRMVEELA